MSDVLTTLGRQATDVFTPRPGDLVGRLTIMHSGEADAIWADESQCEVSGRLRLARTLGVTPVAGDWVAVKGERVTTVFPRRNELRRTQTHGRPAQVLAANVDVVFVVVPLRSELHHRMIEGLTTMARDANATPVVVITKVDEEGDSSDVASLRSHVDDLVGPIAIVECSSVTGDGVDEIRSLLGPGVTGVLLGASGAGKTSLLNALGGHHELTRTLSRTGEGRHATTTRKLYRLSSGGVLLDIPGIRFSRAVVDANRAEPDFSDLDELALSCRFTNCGHGTDLGCAIAAAVAAGTESETRVALWRSYRT